MFLSSSRNMINIISKLTIVTAAVVNSGNCLDVGNRYGKLKRLLAINHRNLGIRRENILKSVKQFTNEFIRIRIHHACLRLQSFALWTVCKCILCLCACGDEAGRACFKKGSGCLTM